MIFHIVPDTRKVLADKHKDDGKALQNVSRQQPPICY